MPSAVSQRSSPSTLTTIDSTTITAMLVARNRKMRFMCFLLLCPALDRARRLWFQEGPGAFLGNDIRRGVGIAGGYPGKDRGVDDPQPAEAVHPQLIIHHRERIAAHLAGAHG